MQIKDLAVISGLFGPPEKIATEKTVIQHLDLLGSNRNTVK